MRQTGALKQVLFKMPRTQVRSKPQSVGPYPVPTEPLTAIASRLPALSKTQGAKRSKRLPPSSRAFGLAQGCCRFFSWRGKIRTDLSGVEHFPFENTLLPHAARLHGIVAGESCAVAVCTPSGLQLPLP